MIAFALSRDPRKARKLAEEIAQRQKHRFTKPIKRAELETRLGYACIIARQGEIVSSVDAIASCRTIPENPNFLKELSRINNVEGLSAKLNEFKLFFSGIVASTDSVILFRDHVGHVPLAYGRIGRDYVSALERHALAFEAELLPPGSLLLIEEQRYEVVKWYRPVPRKGDNLKKMLSEALIQAVEKLIPEKCSIAFSGGLDSSLLAYLALKIGKRLEAFVTGFEGCLDHAWALEAADLLGLNLKVIKLTEEEVLEAVQLLRKFLPRKNAMDLAIASIFYIVSKNSSYKHVITGQGSDELFGGYWKYANALEKYGIGKVAELMKKDIENLHVVNIERDELASALAGSQLIAPYLDRDIYELALSIDPELKVRKIDGEIVRKWILREVAKELGLPDKLVERPKKAAQYSSGILKRLRKLLEKS